MREDEWPGQPPNPTRNEGRPNRFNWFGTNQQGFDVFAQMVHGTQTALIASALCRWASPPRSASSSGAMAGYFGGWVDMALSRLIEVVMCIPSLVLILALVAVLEQADDLASDGDSGRHQLDGHRPA